jgi:ribosomal protein S18 acetylase RimI-like enzyme
MLITRPATLADEDCFMGLLAQLMESAPEKEDMLRPAFRHLLENPGRGGVLLAQDETGILGLITFSYNFAIRYGGFYAQIEELVVDTAARGKQVGATLVQASIAASREHGCKEIGLYAMPHNQPFYEKQGFAFVGPELRQPL